MQGSESIPAQPQPFRRIYFLINGIQNWPGAPKNWNKRACTWIHQNVHPKTGAVAQTDEYFTTALTVWIHEQDRVEVFAALLKQFDGWEIIVIAHSNGTRIAAGALRIAHWVKIKEIHLVSGAVDANFERNGLGAALYSNQVGTVFCYTAGRDWAMRIEDTIAGKTLFGVYRRGQPLGLRGPQNVNKVMLDQRRVRWIVEKEYGHSSWFEDKNFEKSMRMFVQNENVA